MALAAVADGAEMAAASATVATAEAIERVPLPRTRVPLTLEATALDMTLVLRAGRDAAMVATKMAGRLGTLCPKAVARGDQVELTCTSRRIEAEIVTERNATFLDISLLRGVPWRPGPDGPPRVHYAPEKVGLGGACPGTTVAGKGECAYALGQWAESAELFRKALETADHAMAALRLGDLALVALDPATAIGWYQRVGKSGVWGRVAGARLCEFREACFSQRPTLDPHIIDLPAPLRDDLTLRRARVEGYLGHNAKALMVLSEAFRIDEEKSLCMGGGESACRRIVLSALRNTAVGDSDLAMEIYLELPALEQGPFRIELASAGAEASLRLGAPVFGAKLLASVAPEVAPSHLGEHLLRTAELFLLGRDPARARVIVEFLSAREGKLPATPRWTAVAHRLAKEGTEESPMVVTDTVALRSALVKEELNTAATSLKRARVMLEENGMFEPGSIAGGR